MPYPPNPNNAAAFWVWPFGDRGLLAGQRINSICSHGCISPFATATYYYNTTDGQWEYARHVNDDEQGFTESESTILSDSLASTNGVKPRMVIHKINGEERVVLPQDDGMSAPPGRALVTARCVTLVICVFFCSYQLVGKPMDVTLQRLLTSIMHLASALVYVPCHATHRSGQSLLSYFIIF